MPACSLPICDTFLIHFNLLELWLPGPKLELLGKAAPAWAQEDATGSWLLVGPEVLD